MSNEQRAPGWLGYIGDELLPSLFWDYFINHEIRIPFLTNQDPNMLLPSSLGKLFA